MFQINYPHNLHFIALMSISNNKTQKYCPFLSFAPVTSTLLRPSLFQRIKCKIDDTQDVLQ